MHWRKVHRFFSFYSSTSGRRASPAYPVLYASLQCKLGSNSGRIAYFTQNWLMGITTGERYTGFQVFISRLSPPVLLPRRARFYAKLVNWVSPLAKGALVFQVFIPQLPVAGQALLTQFW